MNSVILYFCTIVLIIHAMALPALLLALALCTRLARPFATLEPLDNSAQTLTQYYFASFDF